MANALPSTIQERIEQIRERAQDEQMCLPFPDWPNDRRAAPNDMIRSALFGVVQRGRRKMLEDQELPAPPGWQLFYRGRRLDQIDLDIWLEVMHRARGLKPGEEIRFTLRSVLKALGYNAGKSDYDWLVGRLDDMTRSGFLYRKKDRPKHVSTGATGGLFRDFHIDEVNGEAIVETNPRLRSLYNSITYLDFAERLALGSQLAKWLHALLASHVQWMPTKVETLMEQSGASYARLRDFRTDLRVALEVLKTRQVIRAWSIDAADQVHISKDGTPSQQRRLASSTMRSE